jgi:hypothetical protein
VHPAGPLTGGHISKNHASRVEAKLTSLSLSNPARRIKVFTRGGGSRLLEHATKEKTMPDYTTTVARTDEGGVRHEALPCTKLEDVRPIVEWSENGWASTLLKKVLIRYTSGHMYFLHN